MNFKKFLFRLLPVTGILCLIAVALPVNPVRAAPNYQVIASGLDNPRGLAFDSAGRLFVAEAGKGGSGPCVDSPEGGKECFGATGAITRIYQGEQERIVTGLPSMAGEDGSNAGGPHDVSVIRPGALKVVIGLGGKAEDRDKLGSPVTALGTLIHVSGADSGPTATVRWGKSVDLAVYEQTHNPDKGENDSNPYAVYTGPGGNSLIADAGGNDLLRVTRNGRVSTVAVFPDRMVDAPASLNMPAGAKIPMQSVPTSIARGNHGEFYVGELTGFPFQTGAARVFVMNGMRDAQPRVFVDGFTNIISLAVDKDDNVYVLEIAKNGLPDAEVNGPIGQVTRISPTGERTVLASEGLSAPTGIAVGPDHALYIANNGTLAGQGEIIRIPL